MKDYINNLFNNQSFQVIIGFICFAVVIGGFGEYRRQTLENELILRTGSLASSAIILEGEIKGLEDKVTGIVTQNNLLSNTVQTEIAKNSNLADQVEQVNDTAEALDKLSKLDPQLLQKYSKVYFLNEHYEPTELMTIPFRYTYEKNKEYEIHAEVEPFLEKMLNAAIEDGLDLKIISAYRSFGTQAVLKSGYQVVYGAGTANQFSADQGFSEHQLGTTVDFTTSTLKENFDTFDKTPEYTWLKKNAYEYGFILSYPVNNAYYTFEPWHWRFVGESLAYKLHRVGKNFYDYDQRVINNYLGVIFD